MRSGVILETLEADQLATQKQVSHLREKCWVSFLLRPFRYTEDPIEQKRENDVRPGEYQRDPEISPPGGNANAQSGQKRVRGRDGTEFALPGGGGVQQSAACVTDVFLEVGAASLMCGGGEPH